MADIESNIRFGVDTSDAIASIKALQAQISVFQKQMASSSAANAESARKLRRGLLDDLNATGQWSASIKTIKSSSESFTNALEKNKLSMGEYFKFGASQVSGFRSIFSKEFNTIEKVARERVKDLQTQYISLGRDANGALKAIAVRPLKLDMENLATQTAINAQRQQIFNQLLKQGSTNLLNFGKNTQWAGRQLMVGFTIPLSIFGTQAAKTFMELEEQAIRFKRVYGELFTPPEEADQMLETLKELGKEFTKYGVAVEKTLGLAADAAAMGKTGTALLDQVTEANRLAVLGSVDQQQALETTISLTNAFGIATADLAKKIDFLNAVENQTVVSIEDLTIAIPKAGPVIQQLGGDVEDLAFFLTAMKEGGINASEGANALKSGLASLINPTDQAANMLKVFGINIRDIVAQSRGDVKKLVVDFATALDQLDPSQRAQAIEQLFGKFQFARLSTLFQNVIQEGTQAQRVLELTNATTQELAQLSSKELKRVEESTTFRFRKAIEEFQAAIAPVGEEFLKLITPIIEFATKIIERFNSLSDGAKSFITGLTVLLGAVGPVALMTFGLLANGIANIIKGFTFIRELFQRTGKQSTILGEQFDYMTTEQLQAAAVAASLDQVHQTLIQTFSSEASAVKRLGDVYRQAFNEQQRFDTGRAIARQAGLRLASGIISVPGPKGAGDVVPAMLSPGEAVIPADKAKKYAPLVQGMIAGNIPGFSKGAFLGMPRSGKGTQKDREAAQQIYEQFLTSTYANVPPREYGHQLAKTTGHSFPIFGLGGVYMSPEGKRVFVKPVIDEKSALAEMRSTEITRKAHGLKAPEQRIVVMRDPTDIKRERKFLALESALDATFVNNDPMAIFNEDQYFKQLVASLLRVDKDLSASNVFGDVVADVGPAGVFSRASGARSYADSLPSMEQQAMINLLGIKGGAKKAFAQSTAALMANLTPQQYHQRMISEIQQVLPLLKQTIASFGLTDPAEVKVYDDMIKRLEQGLGVDWSKFHAIHSAVKPEASNKQSVRGYADGVLSVPGPKGAGDTVPAMLSPGEAVIPAKKAKKYASLIQAIIAGNIPGFNGGTLGAAKQRYAKEIDIFPELESAVDSLVGELEESGASQARIFEELDAALRPLIKMLQTTKAANPEGGARSSSFIGTNLSHGGRKLVLTKEQANDIGQQLIASGKAGRTSQFLANAQGPVNAKSNLVFPLPRAFNDPTGGMSGAEISQWIKEDKERFMSFIYQNYGRQAGLDPNDPELMLFADNIANNLEQAGARVVDDPEFYTIIENGIRDMATSAAKRALEDARDDIASIDVKGRPEPMQVGTRIAVSGKRNLEDGISFAADDVALAQSVASGGYSGLRRSKTSIESKAIFDEQSDEFVIRVLRERVRNILERGLGIKSPSEEYQNISNAVTAGVRAGADDAQQAGQVIGETIADSAAESGIKRRIRRASSDPETAAWISQQNSQSQQMERSPRRTQRRVTRMGDKEARELAEAQTRQSQATEISSENINENSSVVANNTEKLLKMNSIVMNGTFALSSLTGVLSLFGGQFAELNQQIFGITTAMFALMQIVQVLTQAKIAELAASRIAVAQQAMAFATYGTGIAAANGFTGAIIRAGIGINAALGPIGWVVLGLTALASIITAVIGANEEQKKKIQGMGDAAFIAGEKLKKIGELYGFDPKQGTIGTAFVGEGTSSLAAEKKASELSTSEQFALDYATEIKGVSEATDAQASAILQSLSESLYAAGADQSIVEAIIKTIRDKANKTNLDISFASINVEEDPSKLGAGLNKAVDSFALALQERAKEKNVEIDLGKTTLRDIEFDAGTSFINTLKDDAVVAAGSFAGALTNLNTQLYNGTITSDEFNQKISEVQQQWADLGIAGQEIVLPDLAAQLNAQKTLEGITNTTDAFLILKAAASGLPSEEIAEYANILREAQKDPITGKLTEDPKKIKAAENARKKLNTVIGKTAEGLRENVLQGEREAFINEQIGSATAQLNDRVVALQNQSEAYQFLIDQGYDAATAFDLAGDAGLAAGIKAAAGAGVASQEWKDIKALLDQVINLEKTAPKGPTAGGGEKSPYQQAKESLEEQRKEIINNSIAFNKLRKAGFDTASAMKAAEDPILAAALATTKVGTKAWAELVNKIKQVQALLSKKEMQELLKGGKVEIADKRAQIAVSGALSTLGWTAEQIDEALSDQEFTNTLAKDLEDGVINSQDLLNRLSQIKQLGSLETELNFTTKEGAADEFQKIYDKAVGYLEAQKQVIEVDFRIKTAADNIIIREAEALIADIQDDIDDLDADLVSVQDQEEVINEKYDNRRKALDDIAKANENIAKQQKSQLTLADALSQGDIAAAARAVQEMRAADAQARVAKQGDLLELSKEKELSAVRSISGKSRKQIEDEIKKLKKDIFDIEEKTLEPARQRIRLAELEKARQLDSLDAQILKWDELAAKVNLAKLKLTPEEMEAMLFQAGVIADMLKNWDDIKDKTATLTVIKKTLDEGAGSTGGGGDGVGGSSSSTDTGPNVKDDKDVKPGSAPTGIALSTVKELTTAVNASKARTDAIDTQIKARADLMKQVSGSPAIVAGLQKQNAADAYTKSWELKAQQAMTDKANSLATSKSIVVADRIAKASGGLIMPSIGSDTVPAMLTPGEFVVRRPAVRSFGLDRLKAINSGAFNGDSMYNYEINVNVQTDANPDQIARAVIGQIKQIDAQRIRGNRF